MNFFNSFVLFVVAAVMALAALVQSIVALFEFLRKRPSRWIFVVCIVVCLLISGLAGYGALNVPASTSSNSLVVASPNPSTPPSSSVVGTGSQMPSPTDAAPPTDTPSSTSTPLPTNTPSPVPTLPPTPGPATRAAVLPFIMNCGCSSNPIQVRVTGVTIQQSLGRMIWNLTVLNIGTERLSPQFRQIALDLNGQLSFAEGGMVDTPVPLAPYGQSGDTEQSSIIFTFIPQQGTYTLKAIMDLCQGICDTVFYNGQPFTFQ